MILPSFKEEQILNELLTDYAEVKRDVRKTVKKRQRAAQKRGTPSVMDLSRCWQPEQRTGTTGFVASITSVIDKPHGTFLPAVKQRVGEDVKITIF